MATFYDNWKTREDVVRDYAAQTPTEDELVYAGYTYEGYEGAALVVFVRDGQWFENHDYHCSCYGLENWSPEGTTPAAILMRPETDWPGLHDAVRERAK